MTDTLTAGILQVENLDISYGSFKAVKDVTFGVNGGEIFGLLGPNGAGKTSTLSAIEGLVKADSGIITVAGFDIRRQPMKAKANMGVQLQSSNFQQELTAPEIIELYAGLYGLPPLNGNLSSIMRELKLEDSMKKKFSQLSGGQQQRVSLYIATIHNPQLVLLDEPTTGLDPQSRRQLWERIEAMRDKGNAILLTTHSMEEAEAVCDRIAIIDHGRIIATDTPSLLIEKHRDEPDVIAASRRGKITLEDIFIGLTGRTVRK
ncbi:MAG: ABC transporter ATP-binding protein [Candidatus Dadabacteria bacterium]